MRKLLIYLHKLRGVKNMNNWTMLQLCFGEHYMGLPLLVIVICIILGLMF